MDYQQCNYLHLSHAKMQKLKKEYPFLLQKNLQILKSIIEFFLPHLKFDFSLVAFFKLDFCTT